MKVLILSCTIVLCCGLVVASPLKDSAINTLKEDNNVAALEAETDSEDVERAKKNIATHLCYPDLCSGGNCEEAFLVPINSQSQHIGGQQLGSQSMLSGGIPMCMDGGLGFAPIQGSSSLPFIQSVPNPGSTSVQFIQQQPQVFQPAPQLMQPAPQIYQQPPQIVQQASMDSGFNQAPSIACFLSSPGPAPQPQPPSQPIFVQPPSAPQPTQTILMQAPAPQPTPTIFLQQAPAPAPAAPQPAPTILLQQVPAAPSPPPQPTHTILLQQAPAPAPPPQQPTQTILVQQQPAQASAPSGSAPGQSSPSFSSISIQPSAPASPTFSSAPSGPSYSSGPSYPSQPTQPAYYSAPPSQPVYQPAYQPAPPSQPIYQPAPPSQPIYQPAPPSQPIYQPAPPSQPIYQPAPLSQPAYYPVAPAGVPHHHVGPHMVTITDSVHGGHQCTCSDLPPNHYPANPYPGVRCLRDAATGTNAQTTTTADKQPATETSSDAKARVERLAQTDSQHMMQQRGQQAVYAQRSPHPLYAIHQQMSQPMSSLMSNYPQSLAFGNSPNTKRQTEQANQQPSGVAVDTKNVTKRSEMMGANLAETAQLVPHLDAKDLAQKVAPIKKRMTDAVKVEETKVVEKAKVADKTKA